jgi:hypothetical protein
MVAEWRMLNLLPLLSSTSKMTATIRPRSASGDCGRRKKNSLPCKLSNEGDTDGFSRGGNGTSKSSCFDGARKAQRFGLRNAHPYKPHCFAGTLVIEREDHKPPLCDRLAAKTKPFNRGKRLCFVARPVRAKIVEGQHDRNRTHNGTDPRWRQPAFKCSRQHRTAPSFDGSCPSRAIWTQACRHPISKILVTSRCLFDPAACCRLVTPHDDLEATRTIRTPRAPSPR